MDISLTEFQFTTLQRLYKTKTPAIVVLDPASDESDEVKNSAIRQQTEFAYLAKVGLFKDVTQKLSKKLDDSYTSGRTFKAYAVTYSAIELMECVEKGIVH